MGDQHKKNQPFGSPRNLEKLPPLGRPACLLSSCGSSKAALERDQKLLQDWHPNLSRFLEGSFLGWKKETPAKNIFCLPGLWKTKGPQKSEKEKGELILGKFLTLSHAQSHPPALVAELKGGNAQSGSPQVQTTTCSKWLKRAQAMLIASLNYHMPLCFFSPLFRATRRPRTKASVRSARSRLSPNWALGPEKSNSSDLRSGGWSGLHVV